MKTIHLILLALVLMISFSCKEKATAVEPMLSFNDLQGVWIKQHDPLWFEGFELTQSGAMLPLGIDYETGMVTLDSTAVFIDTLEVSGNSFKRKLSGFYTGSVITGSYRLADDSLIFSGFNAPKFEMGSRFKRVRLGERLTGARINYMRADLVQNQTQTIFQNRRVSPRPSVQVFQRTENDSIRFMLEGNGSNQGLILQISYFTGAGTYPINSQNKAFYAIGFSIDQDMVYQTTDQGQIVIERYDASAKICEGRFEFVVSSTPLYAPIRVERGVFRVSLN
jgi:hypothetical protein